MARAEVDHYNLEWLSHVHVVNQFAQVGSVVRAQDGFEALGGCGPKQKNTHN